MASVPTLTSPYLRVDEAAEYARVSVRTIRRLLDSGRLAKFKLGGSILIRAADLDALIRPTGLDPAD